MNAMLKHSGTASPSHRRMLFLLARGLLSRNSSWHLVALLLMRSWVQVVHEKSRSSQGTQRDTRLGSLERRKGGVSNHWD